MASKVRAARSRVEEQVASFVNRELPAFVAWAKKKKRGNPRCYAQLNPANHVYDLADGSHTVYFARSVSAIDRAREDERKASSQWYAFKIVCDGRFSDLLAFIRTNKCLDVKRELGIALFHAFSNNLLCNYPEYRALQENWSNTPDNSAFQEAVADEILRTLASANLLS